MSNSDFPGYGGKRPLLYVAADRLLLDEKNPRLTKTQQGADQEGLQKILFKFFNLGELATSMSENGYFDEEPLVGVPVGLPKKFDGLNYEELRDDKAYQAFLAAPTTAFTIVEGNRRLCTVKLLLSGERFSAIDDQIRADLERLPVIIYPRRRDVVAYLGVRHIIGITRWDAYAKARYIATMHKDYGMSIDEIQRMVGDTTNSARKTYASYKLVETMEEELEIDVSDAKEDFSYIVLALGQGPVKEFLGIPRRWAAVDLDQIVPLDKQRNLVDLFSWLFGDGSHLKRVIAESRDITGKLTDILRNEEAIQYLRQTRNLDRAWERSDGERELLARYLLRGRDNLRDAAGLVPTNNHEDIRKLIEECKTAADTLLKMVDR